MDAAKFLIDTLVDGDEFGMVTFDHDASILLPLSEVNPASRAALRSTVDGLTADGCTSIGDGLFEAASNFAQRYDLAPDPNTAQSLILLSDGINTAGLPPELYYDPTTAGDRLGNMDGAEVSPRCGLSDPNPADTLPWFEGALEWYARKRNPATPVPRISTIALGQDADLVQLSDLTLSTIGNYFWAPAAGTAAELGSTAQGLEDSFRQVANMAMGWARLSAGTVTIPTYIPAFAVDDLVRVLQVHYSLREASPNPMIGLEAPDGTLHGPIRVTDRSAVYRIADPLPGVWEFVGGGPLPPPTAPGPRVYAEAIVDSPLVLLGDAHVETARPSADPSERGNFVGKDVYLRAIPTEGRRMLGISVSAEIIAPDGSSVDVDLADDGLSGDGAADDGTYGAVLRDLTLAGAYMARFAATGTTPPGVPPSGGSSLAASCSKTLPTRMVTAYLTFAIPIPTSWTPWRIPTVTG